MIVDTAGRCLAHLIKGDVELLQRFASSADGGLIVEIGSWMGFSAISMATAAPRSTVLCIDTWEGAAEHAGMAELKDIRREFLENTRSMLNIVSLRMRSSDAADRFYGRISLLFVDGAHDVNSVHDDIRKWCPMVVRGGVALFHDCKPGSGVEAAVVGSGMRYTVHAPPEAHWVAEVRL